SDDSIASTSIASDTATCGIVRARRPETRRRGRPSPGVRSCRFQVAAHVDSLAAIRGPVEDRMRYMLTFFADEQEWLALNEADRNDAIVAIGGWFAEHAQSGRLVDGHRLAPRAATKTVRHGRVRKKDLAMISDGP